MAAGGEVKADNLQAVLNAWLDGKDGWNYPTCTSGYCGAYKQVIWADTTHVGCGWVLCPNDQYGYYWVCNYGVGGNIAGYNPYASTPYVSESSECTNDRYLGLPSVVSGDACDSSYMLSKSAASPSKVLDVDHINTLLKGHNDLRRAVTPYADTMPMLQWNQDLANFAQQYLDTCPGLKTSPVSRRQDRTRFPDWWYVGENMVAGEDLGLDFVQDAIRAWSAGGGGWTYPRNCASGYYCTAYQQMIWSATTQIGCAYKYCPNDQYKHYWVCNYGIGGSIAGENPFVSQSDLTQSASCTAARSSSASSRRMEPMSLNSDKFVVLADEKPQSEDVDKMDPLDGPKPDDQEGHIKPERSIPVNLYKMRSDGLAEELADPADVVQRVAVAQDVVQEEGVVKPNASPAMSMSIAALMLIIAALSMSM
eukprot:GILK01009828.1.p1 GENE.GILK01009828.1~~GILK01009828.1.p1  ORF type:complete len:445 (+),score=16.02 GILK01009828.1:70-1335(+)